MNLISVHTLLPRIVPLLNGCNDDLANIILSDAARTFARESDIVIETRGFADYEAPAYGRMPEFALEPDKFVPLHFIYRQEDRENKRVYVTYSMLPISEYMPESVVVRHYEAITSQALFQLFSMPNKPWSNPQMAEMNLTKYRIALGDAIRDNVTGGAVFDQSIYCLDIGDAPYVGEQNVTATFIGTDTSSGNLTPSKMLTGAVGYSKGERVEGDIDTVTPQMNRNTFSVEDGYVAAPVSYTIPESTITDNGNNIIVTSGYVGSQQTIPSGTAALQQTESELEKI
jgi:hypothetical protein